MQGVSPSQIQNRLLRTLPSAELDELLPSLQPVPMPLRQVLHRRGDHVDFAYFPETGMISVVVDLEDGSTIEVGTIGNEGVAPSILVLGSEVTRNEAMVQIEGSALRMSADTLRHCLGEHEPLRQIRRNLSPAGRANCSVQCRSQHRATLRPMAAAGARQDRL
jgi:CRP-like cAMP-binding protein